ncbi:hypothetical protein QBC45DRAFT_43321 [Copromyces sp. CBS 386.78]|nr:hypothetical protein QBC45DRAFT_43321 [Copromyces sp. CBS 386.78]
MVTISWSLGCGVAWLLGLLCLLAWRSGTGLPSGFGGCCGASENSVANSKHQARNGLFCPANARDYFQRSSANQCDFGFKVRSESYFCAPRTSTVDGIGWDGVMLSGPPGLGGVFQGTRPTPPTVDHHGLRTVRNLGTLPGLSAAALDWISLPSGARSPLRISPPPSPSGL